jgi:2-phosphoglycerate kinase
VRVASDLAHVLWMGGSPCSGKSSIAGMLAEKYGLQVYKCDDAFWEHAKRVDPVVHPTFYRLTRMTWDELWMRPVAVQIADEFACYREQFGMIIDDLLALPRSVSVVAEGAALLPDLVSGLLPDRSQAVWIIPTEPFQREHYTPEKRPFINDILAHCQNPTQVFTNWMDRDVGFAKRVAEQAQALDLKVVTVDGQRTIEQDAEIVAQYFRLEQGRQVQ